MNRLVFSARKCARYLVAVAVSQVNRLAFSARKCARHPVAAAVSQVNRPAADVFIQEVQHGKQL
jgi:hypothetical protein